MRATQVRSGANEEYAMGRITMGEEAVITRMALQESLERSRNIRARYMLELQTLPVGEVQVRKNRNKEYYFLNYLVEGKILSVNVGRKTPEKLLRIQEELNKRSQIEYILKRLLEEEMEMRGSYS